MVRTKTNKQIVFHHKFLHNASDSSTAVTSLDIIYRLYDSYQKKIYRLYDQHILIIVKEDL